MSVGIVKISLEKPFRQFKGDGVQWNGLCSTQDVDNPGETGHGTTVCKIKPAIQDGVLVRNDYFEM